MAGTPISWRKSRVCFRLPLTILRSAISNLVSQMTTAYCFYSIIISCLKMIHDAFYHHVIFFRQQKDYSTRSHLLGSWQPFRNSRLSRRVNFKSLVHKLVGLFSSLCHCCNAYCGQEKNQTFQYDPCFAYDFSAGRNYTAQAPDGYLRCGYGRSIWRCISLSGRFPS